MPDVRVGGINLHYEDAGSGPAVVFVHGLGSYSGDWAPQMQALAGSFRVVAVDLRGHGQSQKPPGPYTIARFAGDVAALIAELNLAPAHVVGLSLGGAVAFQLGVDAPSLVRSLVIINSGPSFVVSSAQLRFVVWLRLAVLKAFGLGTLGKMIVKRLFPKPDQGRLRSEFLSHFVTNEPAAYEASLRSMIGWTVADRLGSLRCPVLVISGDRDYTPVEAKQAYLSAIPSGRLAVISDGGHACTLERPDEVNRTLRAFFQSGVTSA